MAKSSAMLRLVAVLMLGLVCACEAGETNWNKYAQSRVDVLHSESPKISADKVYEYLQDLIEIEDHYIGYQGYVQDSVRESFELRNPIECPNWDKLESFVDRLRFAPANSNLYDYTLDCFGRYLTECGLEELFKKEVSYIPEDWLKQWSSYPYQTLLSYFSGEFWPIIRTNDGSSISELNWLLSLIREMAQLENMNRDSCSNEKSLNILVSGLTNSAQHYAELYKLVVAHLVKYLEFCGYEDSFKNIMQRYGIEAEGGDLALHNYLMGEFWAQISDNQQNMARDDVSDSFEGNILYALKLISKLNLIDESNCDQTDVTDFLRNSDMVTEYDNYSKLHQCVNTSFTRHLKACEDSFKLLGQNFEQNRSEDWNFLNTITLAAEEKLTSIEPDKYVAVRMEEAIELAQSQILAYDENIKKYGDQRDRFEADHRRICGDFFKQMWPSFYGFCLEDPAIDADFKKYGTTLDYCGIILHKNYGVCQEMFDKLRNPPFFGVSAPQ